MSTPTTRCKDCGARIVTQEEKALSGEVQEVWADHEGDWVCPVTGNEHEPGTPEPGTFIVVEGSPVDGFVFHGIPAFQTHEIAVEWAENNCSEWWVAPLQDVE
jgi:hypothetical protein